ncbi:MAG: 30S ribosome-binding factor RbfA [Candidatus Omnitrophica bacterium]|nr:30S ribosome-binding factor RbfA [Candidatus Omnitrophota bacterium]
MSRQRPERIQEAIRQEISMIAQSQIKDPRIGFITITKVDLTKDLRYARIYFSVLGKSADKNKALRGLNSAKGYIKGLIADRIKLRFMPEISFVIDNTLEHTQHIYEILNGIKKPKEETDDGEGNTGDKEA